jgi:hypothetical protein
LSQQKLGDDLKPILLALEIRNGTLEIRHIETGQLAGGENSTQSVKNKFSTVITASITTLFKGVHSPFVLGGWKSLRAGPAN